VARLAGVQLAIAEAALKNVSPSITDPKARMAAAIEGIKRSSYFREDKAKDAPKLMVRYDPTTTKYGLYKPGSDVPETTYASYSEATSALRSGGGGAAAPRPKRAKEEPDVSILGYSWKSIQKAQQGGGSAALRPFKGDVRDLSQQANQKIGEVVALAKQAEAHGDPEMARGLRREAERLRGDYTEWETRGDAKDAPEKGRYWFRVAIPPDGTIAKAYYETAQRRDEMVNFLTAYPAGRKILGVGQDAKQAR
jgi:hypothetical protein